MSNNLRQIAKDLRSFVKRCKDVHYSDSLLITFLVTGLLTLAPKTLSADAIQEQQEVSAQAYDTITDLRQSFLRARQENEKSIKGAERELVMLMEQGDQVIKSPWASFQFATGFTNNDWRTSYRGRGGKYLEYYRRNNDLTKYVFDASKHQYGATNLHVQRNQEPNTLEINPANVHEPYRPYVPERLDAMVLPTAPEFNPYMAAPAGVTTYDFTYHGTSENRTAETEVVRTTSENTDYSHNSRTTTFNTNNLTATDNASAGPATFTGTNGTIEASAGNIYNTNWWWGNSGLWTSTGPISGVSGGTFDIGRAQGSRAYYYWTMPNVYSTYTGVAISGTTWSPTVTGADDAATGSYGSGSVTLGAASTTDEIRQWETLRRLRAGTNPANWVTYGGSISAIWEPDTTPLHTSPHVGWRIDGVNYYFSGVSGRTPLPASQLTQPYTGWNTHTPDVSLKADKSGMVVNNNTFTITDKNGTARAGVLVAQSGISMTGNNYTINGTGNVGLVVSSAGTGLNIHQGGTGRNVFNVNGTKNNTGILNDGQIDGLNTPTFSITASESNGIRNNGSGKVTINNGSFDISGTKSNGINNQSGTTSKTTGVTFTMRATKTNGITNAGDLKSYGDTFNMNTDDTNGIIGTA